MAFVLTDAVLYKMTSDVIFQQLHEKEIYRDLGIPQSMEEG